MTPDTKDKPLTKKREDDTLDGKAVAVLETRPIETVDDDPLATIRQQLIEAAEAMSYKACEKLRDPKYIAKLDINTLLEHCTKIMAALNRPNTNVFLPKGLHLNMQQVNNYSNAIANSPTRKQELRDQARRQLKHRPT